MPRLVRLHCLLIAAALCGPAAVEAQICTGRPGAGIGSIHADAEFESFDGGSAASAGVRAVGQQLFMGAAVGRVRYEALGGSTLSVSGLAGYEYPLGVMGRVAVCPMVVWAMGFGPLNIDGSGFDAGYRGASVGASVGVVASTSPRLTVLPTASLALARSSSTLSDGSTTFKTAETYGSVALGVGMVLGRRFAFQPWVLIPIGLEDAGASVGLTLSVTTGRRY